MNALPGLSHETGLLLIAFVAVIGLVVLIGRFKLSAFVALVLASLFVGLCSGLNPPSIAKAFQDGVGGILGSIAMIIGLGTILGKLLAESGGAQTVADTLIRWLGEGRIHWTMMFIGLVVGVSAWFSVGLVLLIPIALTLAKKTGTSLLLPGIPMLAGLSVMHGLVPPHPGPMVATEMFKADAGKTILYSFIVGFPTAILAGPIFGKFIARRVPVEPGKLGEELTRQSPSANPPGFALAVFTILLPVLLMLMATVADVTLGKGNRLRATMDFVGSPVVAMLAATLFSLYSFGFARGFDRRRILKFSEECLAPVAAVLLVVGAGGGFSKVLDACGVGKAIAGVAQSANLSPLILGWLVAALIRVATGSATVAITTAAGILLEYATGRAGTNLELLVISMGAGSLILSHVNDGGFWFVKEYFNLSVVQTLKTWTVMETIISIVALPIVLLLDVSIRR